MAIVHSVLDMIVKEFNFAGSSMDDILCKQDLWLMIDNMCACGSDLLVLAVQIFFVSDGSVILGF